MMCKSKRKQSKFFPLTHIDAIYLARKNILLTSLYDFVIEYLNTYIQFIPDVTERLEVKYGRIFKITV